jgi:hypothetical protein
MNQSTTIPPNDDAYQSLLVRMNNHVVLRMSDKSFRDEEVRDAEADADAELHDGDAGRGACSIHGKLGVGRGAAAAWEGRGGNREND